MTVNQKVLVGLAGIAGAIGLVVVATAIVTSWAVALGLWGGLAAALSLAGLMLPMRDRDLAAGVERETAAELPGVAINPLCEEYVLGHGGPTETVVVLIHGISSCPRAFVELAPLLQRRGHTVFVPRLPCNGYADRSTDALARLTAETLCSFGDQVVDRARGLGREVVVCGISAGGTVAAWVGQNRGDVARVVLVAPFLGLPRLGTTANRLVARLMLLAPNVSLWKDPVLRARFEGMPHAYKRQASRGTAEVMRLGFAVEAQARRAPAAAGTAALVTNDNDGAVDNRLAFRLADLWAERGLAVDRFRFARRHRLGHEIVDPMEPGANPAVTYPVLVALIEGTEPPHR